MIRGAAEAVRRLNEQEIVTCVISNQSGVARGMLSESDLVPIHRRLEEELRRGAARVDRIYYCPHHPTEGIPPYNVDCECRKPKPGMLRQAAQEFSLDLTRSFVIGDSVVDMQVAQAVGATPVLVLTGYGPLAANECKRNGIHVDYVAPSIVEAVDHVLQKIDERTQKKAETRP